MTTDQEPTRARIVPFPAHRIDSQPARHIATSHQLDQEPDPVTDRLLDIRSRDLADPDDPATSRERRPVVLGASSGAFYPHTHTEDVPQLAASLGIPALEIMLQTPGEYDEGFIREVAANARNAGIEIASVHSLTQAHPFLSVYQRRADEALDRFRRGIAAAHTLGARVLVWHGPDRRLMAQEDGWERFVDLSHDLAGLCAEAGVILGIENVSHGPLAQVRDVVRIAERLDEIGGPDRVGFVFDPFQAAEASASPFMMLAAMGNRVVNVHLSDLRERDPGMRHLLPGTGDLPWSALLRAISGSGYRGPMMIEGPLGTSGDGIASVRRVLDPLIRATFPATIGDQAIALSTLPEGVVRGIEMFNAREFYEQHEYIEAEWHAERGPIRRLYQGILQIGVGLHHATNGNATGAIALLTSGIAKVESFTPRMLGIDTARLVVDAQRYLDEVVACPPDRVRDIASSLLPVIHLEEGQRT